MHSLRAIIDVARFQVVRKHRLQPVGKEGGVGIGLNCPVVVVISAVVDDHTPHLDKDPRIQCLAEIATRLALEITVNDYGCVFSNLNSLVAVHGSLVTGEDTYTISFLHFYQALLRAGRPHQGETIE